LKTLNPVGFRGLWSLSIGFYVEKITTVWEVGFNLDILCPSFEIYTMAQVDKRIVNVKQQLQKYLELKWMIYYISLGGGGFATGFIFAYCKS